MGLERLSYCKLQAMCKDKGLKAEGKREELLARLQEADKGAAADSKGEKKKQQKEERKKEEKTSHHAPSGLEKLSKRELQEMCKEQGLRVGGTKKELTARLLAAGAPGSDAAASAHPKDAIQQELKVKEVLARLQKCEPAATTDKGAEAAGKEEKKKTKKKKKEEEERKETQQQEEEEEKKTAHQEAQRAVGNKEQLTACLLEDKPAAPAADDTSPQTASTAAAGLVGLCLGASQDKNNDPAARARKGGDSDDYSPLEKVRTDVKAFKSLLENHFHADSVETRVGHEWSGYMTKTRVLNMVKKELLGKAPPAAGTRGRPEFYALYVLYYAGHALAEKRRFTLSLENKEAVTLENLLGLWAESAPYKAGGSRLLLVVDACFSGQMARDLRAICTRPGQHGTREAEAARTVAIQASCSAKELADDMASFTSLFVKEIEKGQRVLKRRLFVTTTEGPSKQHPEFYCPWGDTEISTGPKGKPFPLYEGLVESIVK